MLQLGKTCRSLKDLNFFYKTDDLDHMDELLQGCPDLVDLGCLRVPAENAEKAEAFYDALRRCDNDKLVITSDAGDMSDLFYLRSFVEDCGMFTGSLRFEYDSIGRERAWYDVHMEFDMEAFTLEFEAPFNLSIEKMGHKGFHLMWMSPEVELRVYGNKRKRNDQATIMPEFEATVNPVSKKIH